MCFVDLRCVASKSQKTFHYETLHMKNIFLRVYVYSSEATPTSRPTFILLCNALIKITLVVFYSLWLLAFPLRYVVPFAARFRRISLPFKSTLSYTHLGSGRCSDIKEVGLGRVVGGQTMLDEVIDCHRFVRLCVGWSILNHTVKEWPHLSNTCTYVYRWIKLRPSSFLTLTPSTCAKDAATFCLCAYSA